MFRQSRRSFTRGRCSFQSFFSTAVGGGPKPQSRSSKIFYRALRVARVVGVSYGIYQVGYRNGLTDYLEHPEEQQQGLIAAVLSMSNSTDVLEEDSPQSKRVTAVAQRVLDTAKDIAVEELRLLEAELAKAERPEEVSSLTDRVDDARVAVRRLSGSWNFFVTNSEDVNAFVTDILPKSIFVNQGLLNKIEPTVDELAMILAHELSHVIHDHNKERSLAQGVIYVFQLMLFALVDPTGQASLLFDFLIGHVVDLLLATHSRANEEEADMTGVKIMSRACYDAVEGSNVFLKLGSLSNSSKTTSWMDTHPSSDTRARYIKEASELHSPSPDCLEMKKDLIRSRRFLHSRDHK